MKGNYRPGLARLSSLLQLVGGLAFFVSLFPDRAIARDLQLEPIGKRVDDGHADAVETARNLVSVAVEFSASMQHRQDDFRGGTLLRGMRVYGDAAAIVHHREGVVGVYRDVNLVRVASQRLVDE